MPGCRLAAADVVRDIVRLLDRAAAQSSATPQQAVVVRIDRLPATADDEVQFALRQLPPGVHPMAYLDGFVAPPTWAGIGLIATGDARPIEDQATAGGRARVVLLLTRDGMLGSGLRIGEDDLHVRVEHVGTGVVGDIPLALCRALGVPCIPHTGPPGGDTPEGDSE